MRFNANGQVEAIRYHVASRIEAYSAVLLAFSGGLDSTVLLDILAALRKDNGRFSNKVALKLRAVHIHHALSNQAEQWAIHCAQECRRYKIDFAVVHVAVNTASCGIEAAARSARYQALIESLTQDEVLLTAQHQDDQAETILLALKRGSGPAGLASMAPDKPCMVGGHFISKRLVRPLLNIGRIELEEYARTCSLHWIEDNSNTDLRFDRNFLRLRILPSLRQRWPQFTQAVTRSAKLCAEQEQLLDELLEEKLTTIIASDGSIHLTALTTMSEGKRAALLRRWLASLGVRMPAHRQLARLWQEVALSRRDSVAQLKLDNWLVRRFRNRLYVVPYLPPFADGAVAFPWPFESEWLALPGKLGNLYRHLVDITSTISTEKHIALPERGFRSRKKQRNNINFTSHVNHTVNTDIIFSGNISCANNTLVLLAIVRAPLPSERVSVYFGPVHGLLYIIGRRRGRTLKKIWQELAIPPWLRSRTPLLFYNDQLIAALGVFITLEGMVQKYHAQWKIFLAPGEY